MITTMACLELPGREILDATGLRYKEFIILQTQVNLLMGQVWTPDCSNVDNLTIIEDIILWRYDAGPAKLSHNDHARWSRPANAKVGKYLDPY